MTDLGSEKAVIKKLFSKYKAYSFWPGIFLKSGLKLKDIEIIEEHINDISKKLEKIRSMTCDVE
jgi:hypothetical protein